LKSPSGELWTWGDGTVEDHVCGNAEDFCLVVTQRRNVADTDLTVYGKWAEQWIQIAQAFAGPPEKMPEPGERMTPIR
jgi:uncharacterized protein (TIGR03084 family)